MTIENQILILEVLLLLSIFHSIILHIKIKTIEKQLLRTVKLIVSQQDKLNYLRDVLHRILKPRKPKNEGEE